MMICKQYDTNSVKAKFPAQFESAYRLCCGFDCLLVYMRSFALTGQSSCWERSIFLGNILYNDCMVGNEPMPFKALPQRIHTLWSHVAIYFSHQQPNKCTFERMPAIQSILNLTCLFYDFLREIRWRKWCRPLVTSVCQHQVRAPHSMCAYLDVSVCAPQALEHE